MNKETLLKFASSLIIGLVAGLLSFYFSQAVEFSLLVGWDCFGLTYLIISIAVFSRIPQSKIKERCAEEDLRSWLLFLLVIITSVASLTTVFVFFDSRKEWEIASWLSSVVGIAAIAISWAIVHTSFTFRYAHLYYGDFNKRYSRHAGGLQFPNDAKPDYFDFAYFSFVIGMAFQVSDVAIASKGIRRLVLAHSVLAFMFNTVIIAMTISELLASKG